MLRYVLQRLAQSVLVIWGVTLLVFAILFLTGDPAVLMVRPDASRQEVEEFRHAMGFDRPWIVQYADFMSRAVQGDFGRSLRQRQPALPLVLERMPATLELTFAAMVVAVVLAFPIGIISATRRGSFWDHASMLFALAGQSMPVFWLGLMLMLILGANLRWLPIAGRGTPGDPVSELQHLVLPALTLSTFSLARNARMLRSSLLDVLGNDYVRTARAKGLADHVVLLRHAVKNALIPVVTLVGLEFGTLLGGAVMVYSLREKEFVEAARALGMSNTRILVRHILPNVVAPVLIVASFAVAGAILSEASLSFLGLGVPPDLPTWGGMVATGRDSIQTGKWWMSAFPGLAIMLTVLSINVVGDWLRDYLDPRLRV